MYMKNDYCVEEKYDCQYLALIVNSSFVYYKNIKNQIIEQVIISAIHQIALFPCLPDTG